MGTLVDDVGSFPLPPQVTADAFDRAYVQARQAFTDGKDVKNDKFLMHNFYEVIVDSFRQKLSAGLDVVNYPQHYDMHKQVTDLIRAAMDKGTYVVDLKDAVLPEIRVIGAEAKELSEQIGKKILLRVCVAGPLELYLKIIGTVFHRDVLLMFAETVRRFAENSILNSNYIKTEVVSLDEPSFGLYDISTDNDAVIHVLEEAFDFTVPTKQIHLHSSLRITDILDVANLDVLAFEYAASPGNIEAVPRRMLDKADKLVRVGVARTDIDTVNAELHDKGIVKPDAEQLVESVEVIQKRFLKARVKYGDRLAFVGPDCGLGGWPTQESALFLLKRTVDSVNVA